MGALGLSGAIGGVGGGRDGGGGGAAPLSDGRANSMPSSLGQALQRAQLEQHMAQLAGACSDVHALYMPCFKCPNLSERSLMLGSRCGAFAIWAPGRCGARTWSSTWRSDSFGPFLESGFLESGHQIFGGPAAVVLHRSIGGLS